MQILYFASIREQLDSDGERWEELGTHKNIRDILNTLQSRGEPWSSVLQEDNLLIARNQEIANFDSQITLEDEIAFFPPVTGGWESLWDRKQPMENMPHKIQVQVADFDPSIEYQELRKKAGSNCGAIVSFVGLVRDSRDYQGVNAIELEHYRPPTPNY